MAWSQNGHFSKKSSLLSQIFLGASGHGANWILNVLDQSGTPVEVPVTIT